VLLTFMSYHHSRALIFASVEEFTAYSFWFRLFHMLLLAYVGGGIFSFVHSYITAVTSEERKKLKWILWGLCIGPMPFLALGIVPHEMGIDSPIPEEYSLLALVIIPGTFTISFVRHRVLDIEVVIRRTTAYAIVIGAVLATYVMLVSAVASLIGHLAASAGAAIVVALLFEPFRVRVQHVVDKHFFRVQYDFRQAEQRFLDKIKHSLTVVQLGEVLVKETDDLIQVERVGFFMLRQPDNRLHLVAHKGFEFLAKHVPRFEIEKLKSALQLPIAIDEGVEPGIVHESANVEVFRRWGMALVFSLLSQESEVIAFLVLGSKKSGTRFSMEDVDLLKNACTQAGLSIERIMLQEKLLVERVESERLRELNLLKSDFVSYVSHELKTPLTSIKMFAELLRARPRKLDKKGIDYAKVIEGESDRLDRMVTTILDAAKMDKGIDVYDMKEIDLVDAAKTALAIMQYQLDKHGFHVEFSLSSLRKRNGITSAGALPILADHDAVVQAITNLISNAIKYSGKRRFLKVSVLRSAERALCRVQDKGVGIPPEVFPHLFEKFYRDPEHSRHVEGVGLGLPLVKHIMDVHNGTVAVESTPAKGSTFTLAFHIATPTKVSQP
jgi:signal transduction histidine kinase